MMPYAPLDTLYAASYARANGYSVALFDTMLAENEDGIRDKISEHQPQYVIIYDDDFNYLTKMCLRRMREAAFRLCAIAREMHCTVIVHGSDSADHAAEYLEHGAEYVIVGEGERTLVELFNTLKIGGRPDKVAGLAYPHAGEIVRTAPREVLHDLDVLPFPAWDLFDFETYRSAWVKAHGYFSMNIVTTRGCPFRS